MTPTAKQSNLKGLKVTQDECIWMKARVIDFKLCDRNYDCINCTSVSYTHLTLPTN